MASASLDDRYGLWTARSACRYCPESPSRGFDLSNQRGPKCIGRSCLVRFPRSNRLDEPICAKALGNPSNSDDGIRVGRLQSGLHVDFRDLQ